MCRLLLDIECDSLDATRAWIVGAIDLDTNEEFYCLEGDLSWQEKFDNAILLVGHNIIGFDLPVLKKLFGWVPKKTTKIHDTMLMSQAQNYRRFPNGRHRLEDWGVFLGEPKINFDDFSKFTPEMLTYWKQDLKVTRKTYVYLLKELSVLSEKKPQFPLSLRNEHTVAQFCRLAEEHGWPFDVENAHKVYEIMSNRMREIEEIIVPKLHLRCVPIDEVKGIYYYKEPKWIKNGNYAQTTAKWFGIDPEAGRLEDPPIGGPYSRVEFFKPDMSNMEDIKIYLYSIGWDPDDWNWKRDPITNGLKKMSPKLSESSLLALGEDGKLINDYMTIKSRHSVLETWISELDSNGRLHGNIFVIGTPTGRATHKIIANIPRVESDWGPEIRSLFTCLPGWKVVGADSSGNQFRALCFYLKNEEFTNLIISGDIHQSNANLLTQILREIGVYTEKEEVKRVTAKPFIYAFLFGAGGEKLSLIVLGKRNKKIGNTLKEEFIEKVPGLRDLVDKINEIFDKTSHHGQNGWIPGLDGRKIYCDSRHKLLNYLLQDFEAITCKAAVAYAKNKLDEENIPYIPLIWYHDEFQLMVKEEFAERALEISIEAYRESAKPFGVNILDGAGKIGNNWKDTH